MKIYSENEEEMFDDAILFQMKQKIEIIILNT